MQKFRQIQAAYEILIGKQRPKFRTSASTSNSFTANSGKTNFSHKKSDDFRRKYGITKEEWLKRKAASERIRQRNSEEAYKALKTGLIWALLFTVFVNIIYPYLSSSYTKLIVNNNPITSMASVNYTLGYQVGFVFKTPIGEKREELRCNYYNETTYLPNGFPARKNDTYVVIFNRNNPNYFFIDFMKPDENLKIELVKTCKVIIERSPEKFSNISSDNTLKFLEEVLNTFGIEGLSIIYNHSTKLYQNIKYNSLVFFFFKHNKRYQDILNKYTIN